MKKILVDKDLMSSLKFEEKKIFLEWTYREDDRR